jgi:hypothetical protein
VSIPTNIVIKVSSLRDTLPKVIKVDNITYKVQEK